MALLNKFFSENELDQSIPQKAVKLFTKLGLIGPNESIKAITGKTLMGSLHEAIIVTDRSVTCFSKDPGSKLGRSSYSLESITGVTLESKSKLGTVFLNLTIGGNEKIAIQHSMQMEDLHKLRDCILTLINKKESNENTQTAASAADELIKFKNLLDMGVISQEEFELKKKKLLDL